MGNSSPKPTMRVLLVVLAIALIASADKLKDLSAADAPTPVKDVAKESADLGEEEGNFGGALMTSGSFTMMAASGAGFGEELGESEGEGNFGGALMTSGSFTMMAASAGGFGEEERDELGEANDWDITNGGQCDESEQAWVMTDAKDTTMGKCVKFAADNKCSAQCFHQGKSVDEAVCTKICRVPGAAGAQCNVIKMVMPQESTNDLGEGKTMYLTRSKVMQAGLKGKDLGEADPMACAGVATNRK